MNDDFMLLTIIHSRKLVIKFKNFTTNFITLLIDL